MRDEQKTTNSSPALQIPLYPWRVANDSDTVAALRARDEDAFRTVVAELTPGLIRLARHYVSEALAEEVAQETWMAVICSIDRFEGRSSLKTWIYRIMLNKVRTLAPREAKVVPFAALGHTRDDTLHAVDPERLMRKGAPGHWTQPPQQWQRLPAEVLEAQETLEKITEAVARLPPAQQEVVELRDIRGWTAEEVCHTLDISSVNQRVLLHRGRTALRNMLGEYFNDA